VVLADAKSLTESDTKTYFRNTGILFSSPSLTKYREFVKSRVLTWGVLKNDGFSKVRNELRSGAKGPTEHLLSTVEPTRDPAMQNGIGTKATPLPVVPTGSSRESITVRERHMSNSAVANSEEVIAGEEEVISEKESLLLDEPMEVAEALPEDSEKRWQLRENISARKRKAKNHKLKNDCFWYGTPKTACLAMASNLARAKHRSKTMLGVTDAHCQHSRLRPVHGMGQGATHGPTPCTFESCTLFDCHETEAHCSSFHSFDKKHQVQFFMVGFADDGAGHVNTMDPTMSIDELIERMNEDAQWWNDLLWTSGGDLEKPKCSCHATKHDFTATGAPVLKPGTFGPPIEIKPGNRQPTDETSQAMQRHSAHTDRETLGHWRLPAGNLTKACKAPKTMSDDAAALSTKTAMRAQDAWTCCFSTCLTKVGHTPQVDHFQPTQSEDTQRQASAE